MNFRDFFLFIVMFFVVSMGENMFEVVWGIMKVDGDVVGFYMVVWCLIMILILVFVFGIFIDCVIEEGKVVLIIIMKVL